MEAPPCPKRTKHGAATPCSKLAGVIAWPRLLLDRLRAYDAAHSASLHSELLRTVERGYVLTTSYSGMGAAETAAALLQDHSSPA